MKTRTSGYLRARFHQLHRLLTIWKEPAWWAVALLFLGFSLPLALLSKQGKYEWDEANYHLPEIRRINKHWPALDLQKDSFSAIAPGYHWFLAGLGKITGTGTRTLRLINLSVSLFGLVLLFAWLRSRHDSLDSALLVAPLAVSNFFVKSASWVVTDNAGLVLVLLTLIVALKKDFRWKSGFVTGIFALAATLTRQLHVWLAGVLLFRVLLSIKEQNSATTSKQNRFWPSLVSLLGACFPIIALGVLYHAWGGLVPEQWREVSFAISFCPLAYISSVFAFLGFFYVLPLLIHPHRGSLNMGYYGLALMCGLLVATLSPSTSDYKAGRWGGYFWSIVNHMPTVFDRSMFFVILTPIGLVVMLALWREMQSAEYSYQAHIWLLSVLAWSSTYLLNRQVFHRYFEPMVLIFLIIAVGFACKPQLQKLQRILLIILIAFQILGTLASAVAKTF